MKHNIVRSTTSESLRRVAARLLLNETTSRSVAKNDRPVTSDEKCTEAACTFIVSDSGMILAVSRRDDPTLFGFPGGHVDPGETASEAAARELEEETGLIITDLNPIFSSHDGSYLVTTFVGKVSGDVHTEEEGVIKWVKPNVLIDPTTCPFVDYNLKLFRAIGLL